MEKNHRTIYDINYEKSFYNNVKSDIDVGDKVRIKLSGKFRKGTDARYTDNVYTVTKVRGNTITLNNDEVYKVNKQNKIDRALKAEGVELVNILENPRTRKKLLDNLS